MQPIGLPSSPIISAEALAAVGIRKRDKRPDDLVLLVILDLDERFQLGAIVLFPLAPHFFESGLSTRPLDPAAPDDALGRDEATRWMQ